MQRDTTIEGTQSGGGSSAPSVEAFAPPLEDIPVTADAIFVPADIPWAEARRRLERRYFTLLLERHRGNVAGVARAAGLDPANLRRVLRRQGLSPARYRSGAAD